MSHFSTLLRRVQGWFADPAHGDAVDKGGADGPAGPSRERKSPPSETQRQRNEMREIRRAGIAANKDRDWSAAAGHWGRLATMQPDDPTPQVQYVRALSRLGHLTEAAAAADVALELHPGHEELLYRRVQLLERLEYVDAVDRLIRSAAFAGAARQSPRLSLQAGRHFWHRGEVLAARPWLETALEDDDTRPQAEVYLARLEYRLGNYEAARGRWEALRDRDDAGVRPEEPLLFLGRIALRQGDREEADRCFERALSIAPKVAGRIAKWRATFDDRDAPLPDAAEDGDGVADDAAAAGDALPAADLPDLGGLDDDAGVDWNAAEESLFREEMDAEPPVEADAEPDDALPEASVDETEPADMAEEIEDLTGEPADLAGEPAETADPELLAAARARSEAGDIGGALDSVRQAFEDFPEDMDLAEFVGFAANRARDWRLAARAWSRLAENQPWRPGPRMQAANAWDRAGEPEMAWRFAEAAREAAPDDPAAWSLGVQLCARLEDLPRLRKLVGNLPEAMNQPRVLLALTDAHVTLGDRTGARRWAERTLAAAPDSPDAKLRMARLLYGAREIEAAEKLWTDLLDAPADRVRPFEPRIFLARCAVYRNDFDAGVDYYREAVALNPKHLDSRDALISLLLRQGDVYEADRENGEIRKLFPDEPRWAFNHLLVAYKLGEALDITERYAEARQQLRGNRDGLVRLGRIIESQRDAELALEHWSGLAADYPRDPTIRYHEIVQLFAQGGSLERLTDLTYELLDISPDHEGGLQYLALLSQRLGRLEEADAACRRGLELYPANIAFWTGHASTLMTADKVPEAQALLDQARHHIPEDTAHGLADLARLAELVEVPDEAQDMLERATALAPEDINIRRRAIRFNLNRGAYGRVWEQAGATRALVMTDDLVNTALSQSAAMLGAIHDDWPRTPPAAYRDNLVPDDLFGRICRTPWPRPQGEAGGVMMVTSTLGSGGSERQVMYSMRGLAEADHGLPAVELAARSLDRYHRHDFFLPLVEETGLPVIDLSESELFDHIRALGGGVVPHREAVRLAGALPPELQVVTLPLLGVFLERRPDIVHLWQDAINIAGGIAALLAGVPKIIMGTRSTRPDSRRRLRRYLLPGYREMLKLPQVTMVNNSHNGARDYEDWIGLSEGEVAVIHNGFDVDQLRRSAETHPVHAEAEALGIPKDAVVMGGVMRFSEEKRPGLFVDVAVELARRMPEAHFLLIGDGPLRPELVRLVRERGLSDRIHLPGAKRPIEPWMRLMSLLFLTSRMEGLPNVLIEAQLLGVPVAATDVGGAKETMVPDTTGILIDSGDPQVLADRIEGLLGDPDRLAAMAEEAGRWAPDSFGLDAMTQATLSIYRGSPAAGQ